MRDKVEQIRQGSPDLLEGSGVHLVYGMILHEIMLVHTGGVNAGEEQGRGSTNAVTDGMILPFFYYTFIELHAAIASRISHHARSRLKRRVCVSPEELLYPWKMMPVHIAIVSLLLSIDTHTGVFDPSTIQFTSPEVLVCTKNHSPAMGKGT